MYIRLLPLLITAVVAANHVQAESLPKIDVDHVMQAVSPYLGIHAVRKPPPVRKTLPPYKGKDSLSPKMLKLPRATIRRGGLTASQREEIRNLIRDTIRDELRLLHRQGIIKTPFRTQASSRV